MTDMPPPGPQDGALQRLRRAIQLAYRAREQPDTELADAVREAADDRVAVCLTVLEDAMTMPTLPAQGTTAAQRAALAALMQTATAAPWSVEQSELSGEWDIAGDTNQDGGAHDGLGWVAGLSLAGEMDARLIAAMRNALPALLADGEALVTCAVEDGRLRDLQSRIEHAMQRLWADGWRDAQQCINAIADIIVPDGTWAGRWQGPVGPAILRLVGPVTSGPGGVLGGEAGVWRIMDQDAETLASHYCSGAMWAVEDLVRRRSERQTAWRERYGPFRVVNEGEEIVFVSV